MWVRYDSWAIRSRYLHMYTIGNKAINTYISKKRRTKELDLHTAVLDLGVAEEPNGGLIALSPDGGAGEVEGVVVLEHWVGLCSEGLKIGLFP